MAMIALRKVPDDLHRKVKRVQLEEEEKGNRINLEELYIELIRKALDSLEKDAALILKEHSKK